MCRKHQISPSLFALWEATFLERLPVVFQAGERHAAAAARVADLERLVGRQALELAALKNASPWPAGATSDGDRSWPARPVRTRFAGRAGSSTAPGPGPTAPRRWRRTRRSSGRRSSGWRGRGRPPGTGR